MPCFALVTALHTLAILSTSFTWNDFPTVLKGTVLKQFNQRESFGIYKLQATKYPGLNEDMDLQITGH
jgi:hypothetical protein